MDIKILSEAADRMLAARMDGGINLSDAELRKLIAEIMDDICRRTNVSIEDRRAVEEKVYNTRRRMGLLQPYLDDASVNEIMINGTDNIFLEKNGRLVQAGERFRSRESIYNTVQSMIAKVNRTVNESNPIADARLPDGSRINIIMAPVAINGHIVTVRKFAEKVFTTDDLIEKGTLRKEEAYFLRKAVLSRMNILISGGTSTGKTTFLNVLASFISEKERIVTIEDSAELILTQPDLVRLETRNANVEGKGEITMRALIKATMRLRPDRIIVGEVRDECAIDMLTALCTGHDGSMSTVHANSSKDAATRLETLALWEGHVGSETVRRLISSGIDLIVHLKRTEEMKRVVDEICEVGDRGAGLEFCTLFKNGERISDCTMKGGKMNEST
ncbi:MAG: CpaF family protein [Clostridia bacterium]|nr:CpaF family protein [Clostridia bacterium]